MAKRLKIDDTSAQVKDFLRQLDVEKGEYVLELEGKPLVGIVPPWQVERSPKGEKRSSLFLTRAGNGIARWKKQKLNLCERSNRRGSAGKAQRRP